MNPEGATVISLCPFPIDEFKPGVIPSNYHIDPAPEGDISVLNLGTNIKSRMRVPVVGNTIDMGVSALTMAKAIVEDRASGQLLYQSNAKPGLFFVPGEYSKEEAKAKFAKEIEEALASQKRWFIHLCRMADDDWHKTHQHKFISDIQRYAAKALGLTKDWNLTIVDAADKRCVACFSQMHMMATICPTCRTNQTDWIKANQPVKPVALKA